VSDEIGEIESTGNNQPSRLLMPAVLLLSIAAVAAPILIARTMLYDEDGISKNALLTHLVLPGVWSVVILLVIALIVRTRVAGDMDVVWYRWSRPEVTLAILFVLIITAVYPLLGVLLRKLGLPPSSNLMFRADRRGLVFYVILTILRAVLGPVLEELFWRGYVQRTLERLLGGLAAFHVQAVPEDVFYYGPLIYRRTGDDFILYSFGADFDDDGGTPSKWGQSEKGGDQVFWPVQESTAYSESAIQVEAL